MRFSKAEKQFLQENEHLLLSVMSLAVELKVAGHDLNVTFDSGTSRLDAKLYVNGYDNVGTDELTYSDKPIYELVIYLNRNPYYNTGVMQEFRKVLGRIKGLPNLKFISLREARLP